MSNLQNRRGNTGSTQQKYERLIQGDLVLQELQGDSGRKWTFYTGKNKQLRTQEIVPICHILHEQKIKRHQLNDILELMKDIDAEDVVLMGQSGLDEEAEKFANCHNILYVDVDVADSNNNNELNAVLSSTEGSKLIIVRM